ncbi:MAG: hypothetical protein ACXWDO_07730 [Bacteroidia bacterium]
MKNLRYAVLLFSLAIFSASCTPIDDDETIEQSEYKPLLMTRDQLSNSVSFQPAKELKNPGKIYYKDGYIFVNERYKGVHIINNQDPKNPQNIAFIQVPGCIDMAMKGNMLYVDNAVDLVTIDLSNTQNPVITSRLTDVFPESTPPDGQMPKEEFRAENRPANTIIVEWIKI